MVFNLPFPVTGTIYQVGGSVAVGSGVRVTMRNETSGNTINTTTNSSGVYLLDAANISGGYQSTDNITVEVIYQTYEASETVTISDGPTTQDLTLAAVTTSTDTNYATVQGVWDELGGLDSTDISAARVIKAIQRAESNIDYRTGTKFVSTTITDEVYRFNYYEGFRDDSMGTYGSQNTRYDYEFSSFQRNRFQLKNRPLLTITSLSINNAGLNAADSWTELTEQTGSSGSFITDLDTGWITFVDNFPTLSYRSIKVSYTYGYSTVPGIVEELTILLAVRTILTATSNQGQFDNADNIRLESVSITNGATASMSYMKHLKDRIDELFVMVGDFNYNLTG